VEKKALFSLLEPPPPWTGLLETWKTAGKLCETDTHFILTQEGRLLADGIASDLFVLP
jgi:hypothetical protein